MIKSAIKKVCKRILPVSAYHGLVQKWNDSKIKICAVKSGGVQFMFLTWCSA